MMHETVMCMVAANGQAKNRCQCARQELIQKGAALKYWTMLAVMQRQHKTLKVQSIQHYQMSCAQPVRGDTECTQSEGQEAQNVDQAGSQGLVSGITQQSTQVPRDHGWQLEYKFSPL